MNEQFVVKASVWKAIFYLVLCLLFVLGGVSLISIDEGLIPTIVGTAAIGFFGFGFFVFLFRGLLDRRPLILIDEKGIDDRRLGVGKINWKDVKSVKLNSRSANDSISVKLVNSEKYLKNLPRVPKILSRFNGDLDFGILTITLIGIDTKPQKVYEMILKYISEKQIEDLDSHYEIK